MSLKHALAFFLFLFAGVLTGSVSAQMDNSPYSYQIRRKAEGTHGAVVSAHPLASKAGITILQQGGNALDAAIATQLALAVVYPGARNIGGGGFMGAHLGKGKNITLDFREKAPAAATRGMYMDGAGNTQAAFKKYNTVMPVFVKEGGWKAGDTLVQKDLARTLRLIRDKGAKGFYEGETAALIVAEMKRGKGIITAADLKGYEAKEREPSVFSYKGYSVVTMPLPSSGGVILQQMMKMVEDQPLKAYGFESVKAVHLMTEVERIAYADRAKYLGDRDYYSVPVKALTSEGYLHQRNALIDPDKAGNSKDIQAGVLSPASEETTHLDVYDGEGNAVSITTTLNGAYGNRAVLPRAGFLLNNQIHHSTVQPGLPNMYGAVGQEANAIAPGKRMLSSMTPTLVLDKGKVFLVVGTPG